MKDKVTWYDSTVQWPYGCSVSEHRLVAARRDERIILPERCGSERRLLPVRTVAVRVDVCGVRVGCETASWTRTAASPAALVLLLLNDTLSSSPLHSLIPLLLLLRCFYESVYFRSKTGTWQRESALPRTLRCSYDYNEMHLTWPKMWRVARWIRLRFACDRWALYKLVL